MCVTEEKKLGCRSGRRSPRQVATQSGVADPCRRGMLPSIRVSGSGSPPPVALELFDAGVVLQEGIVIIVCMRVGLLAATFLIMRSRPRSYASSSYALCAEA